MAKPLLIPIRPIINRIIARRGIQLGPILPSGFEASIYQRLSPGILSTIFDVGANFGQSAGHYYTWFPSARIYCFEPILTTFRKLVVNTESKKDRISCFNLALGDHEGQVRMQVPEENSLMSKIVRTDSNTNMHVNKHAIVDNIKMTSVDQFCSFNGITQLDLIKTDTEGYDLNVLKGAKHMLESSVRFVFCEIGFDESDTQHTPFEAVLGYLGHLNFRYRGTYDTVYEQDGVAIYANALFVHT